MSMLGLLRTTCKIRLAGRLFLNPSKSTQTVRKASSQAAAAISSVKLAYPERLLVYHAGTGRTAFLGISKVSTLLLFLWGTAVLAPAFYKDENEPAYMIPTVVVGSAIPMLFVARSSKPFVCFIHVVLPKNARVSRPALLSHLNSTKQETVLDFSMLKYIGSSRVVRARLGDLRQKGESLKDIANIVYLPGGKRTSFSLARTLRGVQTSFSVPTQFNHAKESKLWEGIFKRIRKLEER